MRQLLEKIFPLGNDAVWSAIYLGGLLIIQKKYIEYKLRKVKRGNLLCSWQGLSTTDAKV
jgi:hypothetical protein